MSTLIFEARASKIWFDNDNMWLNLSDGRQLSIPSSISLGCIKLQNNKGKIMSLVVVVRVFIGMK